TKLLTWAELAIPASASGHAILKVTAPGGKSVILGEYDITPIEREFTEPFIANPISADFPVIGSLIGVDMPQTITHAESPTVQLIWKASNSPRTAYTVFVHLLDADGQVIAQSDRQPAQDSRPTTSWLANEYITDRHQLTWNRSDYTGSATLEVGL